MTTLAILLAGCGDPSSSNPDTPDTDEVAADSADTGDTDVPPLPGRWFDHVIVVVLENQDVEDVLAEPRFAALAERGASLTDFHSLFHPSYPNYLAMVGGKVYETDGDHQLDLPASERTIGHAIEQAGGTWAAYAEGFPGECWTGSYEDDYVRRHVPFLSFASVTTDAVQCANVKPAEDFDPRALPSYAFYAPDIVHDGHEPLDDPEVGLARSGDWLLGTDGNSGFLGALLDDPAVTRSTLVVVTYDESHGTDEENHIFTVLLGDMVVPGDWDGTWNLFSLVRTIEDNFGAEPLGDADAEAGMSDRAAIPLDPAIFR